jgi:adenylyltransferase/sulfurtransferase
MIGMVQATEAIKLITGIGEPLIGRFLIYDALRMRFRELKLRKDPDCPVCGTHPTVTKLIDYEEFCGLRPSVEAEAAAAVAASQKGAKSPDITAVELKERLDRGDAFQLVDVREPNEFQINQIPGAQLIPLGEVPRRYAELDPDQDVVVFCKMGGRSAKAADYLRTVGFKNVQNLKGGILEWIDKVDPSLPRY